MNKTLGIALAASCLWSANAAAGMITDIVEQNVTLGWTQQHNYTHNINDDGFVLGSALSGDLTIDIYDDNDPTYIYTWFGTLTLPDGHEGGLVVVENFDFDTGGGTNGQSDYYSELEIQALAALNADGMLQVSVRSLLGDFVVGDSVLNVVTANVPEPGTLALLGLGIAGLGAARRKKA